MWRLVQLFKQVWPKHLPRRWVVGLDDNDGWEELLPYPWHSCLGKGWRGAGGRKWIGEGERKGDGYRCLVSPFLTLFLTGFLTLDGNNQNHFCGDRAIEETIAVSQMKDAIANTNPITRVYNEYVALAHQNAGAAGMPPPSSIPNFYKIRSSLTRCKAQQCPPVPADFGQVNIVGPFATYWQYCWYSSFLYRYRIHDIHISSSHHQLHA